MNQKKKILSAVVVVMFIILIGNHSMAQTQARQKSGSKSNLVNINTADVASLSTLPRIGEKTAQRIIDYRKKNGKFKRIEDLLKVKGIGEKVFAKFKNLITV